MAMRTMKYLEVHWDVCLGKLMQKLKTFKKFNINIQSIKTLQSRVDIMGCWPRDR